MNFPFIIFCVALLCVGYLFFQIFGRDKTSKGLDTTRVAFILLLCSLLMNIYQLAFFDSKHDRVMNLIEEKEELLRLESKTNTMRTVWWIDSMKTEIEKEILNKTK
jgi:hypothetical protein